MLSNLLTSIPLWHSLQRLGMCLSWIVMLSHHAQAIDQQFDLQPGDHICYIGNTLADRMQHHGWLETYLHALHPDHQLTFRNLGFSGDEVSTRPRSDNFGTPDQWLTKCQADVVFCFFGFNESFRGENGLPGFQEHLSGMIDNMLAQQYNGHSPPRIVMFSPIAHEHLHSPHLPDGFRNNQRLAIYNQAMQAICKTKDILFVDLFAPTKELYAATDTPFTMNGIHLLEHGNQAIAKIIVNTLLPSGALSHLADCRQLREVVLEKNYYWFSRYRVVDGYNVFGGRSTLAWHEQSNADVMQREMEIFDIMTNNWDQRVWAIARGNNTVVEDNNIPELLPVKTNKPGPLPEGTYHYLDGEEAIQKMKLSPGMQVNLFASEKLFPRLVNPVQMAVDTDGRLWASLWPSYPHWNPTKSRRDALAIFPDNDGDGVADDCLIFADELNSITGFEFWGGGVLVAAPPEIWFLQDTDGDDRADVKIRMLQGVSSADTHHTANSMLIGPDGWLYWSRGVFNVTNFETPTKTFRSETSGVYRFNPRTFEVEFHFPIGPNPHGDVFDQWGFQFANDGTSGTGSYVNIGKGIGNKHWFKKRVRPVPATGILSSSHFPPHLQGNFLICNAIGFLGVLQHEIQYNGADIMAREVEPLLVSSDPNFRPSDLEIGGDGALYISDWHNALIGHMQHNMRDPNRDHEHGRIYRVTHVGRNLLTPPKMRALPIHKVCQYFFAKENGTRYRARLELSGRDRAKVIKETGSFATHLNPLRANTTDNEAQALLECLWVFEEQRAPNMNLLTKVYRASEPRIRAAAIRTLGHWAGRVSDWKPILHTAAQDTSALVRAEAVKAAIEFEQAAAAEIIFMVSSQESDPELETVLNYARSKIDLDTFVRNAVAAGKLLSPAAHDYALRNAHIDDLLKMKPTEELFLAMFKRSDATTEQLEYSLDGLAQLTNTDRLKLLLDLITHGNSKEFNLDRLGQILTRQSAEDLHSVQPLLETLATTGQSTTIRQFGYAAWIATAGPDDPFLTAIRNKEQLLHFLTAVPFVEQQIRETLYDKVEPLIFELPATARSTTDTTPSSQNGIRVEYFTPNPNNVSLETLNGMVPQASGVVPEITLDVPQRQDKDHFVLRFTGKLKVPKSGKYTFSTKSDDGSRLYINDQLVVQNDGLHGMTKKSGSVNLSAGHNLLIVTYFDHSGGDGLQVLWEGPGLSQQVIAPSYLTVSEENSLHEVAIEALASIPGHETEKILALGSLIKAGRNRSIAIKALHNISVEHWPSAEIGPMLDNLIGYLSETPPHLRTAGAAADAIALSRSLARLLPTDQAQTELHRLENLDVRVIAIGTVKHRMIFDKERIVVQAGKPVEFRFSNTDAMPHNFAITLPGTLAEVGELGEATGLDPDAIERHYIPKSDTILLASHLLQPGQTQAISMEIPAQPGVYPYVCTYPGHWRRMHGALYVVPDLKAYQANPESYLTALALPIQDELLQLNTRGRNWTFDELIADVKEIHHGRSFEVGKQLFKVANCVGCHQLDKEGRIFGPDLAKLDKIKHNSEHILRSIIEPSKEIDPKYQTYIFELESGKTVTGMIINESPVEIKVVIDPLAKDKATIIAKDDIEQRIQSKVSLMPEGLLNKLSREEIFDLIAFVFSAGDSNNKIFGKHHH